MAVKRFVAFVAGVRVSRVVMVGGVHVLAGAKRTRGGEDERGDEVDRVMRQRDERGERVERRAQRRRIAEQNIRRGAEASRSEGAGGPGVHGASDGSEEFGGARSAGNWGAGGLGDRTGVG